MSSVNKNHHPKINMTDNIQIQKHGGNCGICIINKRTEETADLTEATLEVIIRNNKIPVSDGIYQDYKTNDSIILYLCKEYSEWEAQQKKEQEKI